MNLDVQPMLAGHSHREAPRRQRLADEPSVQPPPSRHSPTIHFKMHSSITPTSPVRSDCWTRYIGVGNMFSGLEIPFEDRPELQPDKVDVTRHTSHVTHHTSHVTRHTSHVICDTQPLVCSHRAPPQIMSIGRPLRDGAPGKRCFIPGIITDIVF